MNDLHFTLRQFRKSPGFSLIATLTIALGIGACTAIFSVVNSVLLSPMPYPDSDRLVSLKEDKLPDLTGFSVAPGNYFSWREQSTTFESLAAELSGNLNLTGVDEPQRLNVRFLTANFLSTLRVHPLLGRDFQPDEDTPGQEKVVLLSHGFWTRQFGGATDIAGKSMILDGDRYTIIGVLPQTFRPKMGIDIYAPAVFGLAGRRNHGAHFLDVTGRLKAGVTLEAARQELSAIALRIAEAFPETNKGWSVHLTPILETTVGSSRLLLLSLLGAVGFLLLIACANVANLLLARATVRVREFSIRAALGANRSRILRQLLLESVTLSTISGLMALILAYWGIHALVAFAPADIPRLAEVSMDLRAFGLTFGLALLTGLGFGLIPAFHASQANPNESFNDGARGSSEGAGKGIFRNGLVVAEIAIALILLVGAGLLIRSVVLLQNVRPGFQPDHATAASLSLSDKRYTTNPQKVEFVDRVTTQLASVAGVRYVAAAAVLPFSGDDFNLRFNIAGRPPLDPSIRQGTLYYPVTAQYFQAMGIELVRGRFFDTRDTAASARVAIINESMAKKHFPAQDPIGQRINLSNGPEQFREIVGIVRDVKHYRLDDAGELTLQTYEPFAQQPYDFMTFVVRTDSTATALPQAIRTAVASVDKDQPISNVRPLAELVAVSLARQKFTMFLFSAFSGAALLLSALGIYGVMSYVVARRTSEIGIRMAVGARRLDILCLVFGQSMRLILLGVAIGIAGALALTRSISTMLYTVSPYDPLTYISIAGILIAVAALACLIPARRAANVDPLVALRAP